MTFTLEKKSTRKHQGQSRKKKDKTHEKAQDSQHDLKKQTILVIGDLIRFSQVFEIKCR